MNHSAQRGLALVAVLWVLVLLALVAASFSRTTRTEINLARNLVENAQAEALADAGVHLAILALLDPDPAKRPRADGTPFQVMFGGAEITVSVQDEGGKIDLNRAPDELLRGLFVSLGVEAAEADALVDAIADFRDADDLLRLNGAEDRDYEDAGLPWGAKDAPFEAVEELRQVIGMTAELYRLVAPALTVYSRRRGIDPDSAPRAVLLALPGAQTVEVSALLDTRNQLSQDSGTGPDTEDDTTDSGAAAQPRRSFGDGFEGSTELFRRVQEAQEDAEDSGEDDSGDTSAGSTGLMGVGKYLSRSRRDIYTLRAEARIPSGAVFVREAVVRLKRGGNPPFIFQTWEQGERSESEAADGE